MHNLISIVTSCTHYLDGRHPLPKRKPLCMNQLSNFQFLKQKFAAMSFELLESQLLAEQTIMAVAFSIPSVASFRKDVMSIQSVSGKFVEWPIWRVGETVQ